MNILPEELQSFKYYQNLIPMYLKNTHGFLEQIKIWYRVFMQSTSTLRCGVDVPCGVKADEKTESMVTDINKIFNFLDIFNKFGSSDFSEADDVLNKLANLFGVTRNFSVEVNDERIQLSLSDSDLLTLIKCQIIKNFFDGTYEQLIKCFEIVNLPILPLTDTSPAHCKMYMLLNSEDEVSQNIKNMFLAGMLSIESMGIHYTYAIQIAENIAIFDSSVSTAVFDAGQFVL